MSRIEPTTSFFMLAVALLLDLVSLIPIVGMLSDVIAAILFGIWFSHHGVSLMKTRPFRYFLTIGAEFIPIVAMVPFWTFFVWSTIASERSSSV